MNEQNETDSDSNLATNSLWILALIIVGAVAFFIGRNSLPTPAKPSAPETTAPLTVPKAIPNTPTPTIDTSTTCEKTGPAQPKDYLTPYILKVGDNFQSIAQEQLNDPTRVSELTTLNQDQKQLTVGSTIYLPPDFIKSSSGHISQVSGKIVLNDNNTNWQLTYGGDPKGPGIIFPGFWFKDLPNSKDFSVGDCVTILFDNGVKVYTVTKN